MFEYSALVGVFVNFTVVWIHDETSKNFRSPRHFFYCLGNL